MIKLSPIILLAAAGWVDAAAPKPDGDGGVAPPDAPSIVAGYQALFTCSATFIADRPLAAILAEELVDVPASMPAPRIHRSGRYVTARTPEGIRRIAAYRPGMGCTVLPEGASTDAIADLPFVVQPNLAFDPETTSWPRGDAMPEPKPGPALRAVLGRAFDGESYGEGSMTVGVVIVHEGEVVAERYRPGFDASTGYRTWSTAKSITHALTGILVRRGLLSLDAPVPIPEWQHPDDPRREITVRDLLHMSSGLRSGGSNTNAIYFGGQDVISAATHTPLAAQPGTRWKYANNDTLLLMRAARHVIDNDFEYLRFPYEALLHPLGMRSTVMEVDHAGNFVSSSQVYTTARDLARFALLYLNDGVFLGERILPEGWTELARTPAPARETPSGEMGYGAQFWLLDTLPGIPEGAYTTAGNKGQLATIVPANELVVVRTGIDPRGVNWSQGALVRDVVDALPTDSPN